MEQRLLSEPCEEFIAIRGVQDLRERIAPPKRGHPCGDRKEKEIMVAKDRDGGRTKIFNVSEDVKRIPTSIDQVPCEPETIVSRIESNCVRELLQGGVTALYVADCISCHMSAHTSADGISSQAMWGVGIVR